MRYDVAIVGGGLAGLINAILLARGGLSVILFEKKQYPFHRVCGEYISNEVRPFLQKHSLFPEELNPSSIDRLLISSVTGKHFESPLSLGGFGVSRFEYDKWLSVKAELSGTSLQTGCRVTNIAHEASHFELSTDLGMFESRLVIASHGKRAKLDRTLNRSFLDHRSPYVGIKYHIKSDFPIDTIALHNFDGGYCGVSSIGNDKLNLCYLVHRDQLKACGSIGQLEAKILKRNPFLNEVFDQSEILFDSPEVINEITFEKKEPVLNSILMCGDAAGMITPLSGNGMAMAIHSAKILSQIILSRVNSYGFNLSEIEANYRSAWNTHFSSRHWAGRQIQKFLFGSNTASELAVFTGRYLKPIARQLIKKTHGTPFN